VRAPSKRRGEKPTLCSEDLKRDDALEEGAPWRPGYRRDLLKGGKASAMRMKRADRKESPERYNLLFRREGRGDETRYVASLAPTWRKKKVFVRKNEGTRSALKEEWRASSSQREEEAEWFFYLGRVKESIRPAIAPEERKEKGGEEELPVRSVMIPRGEREEGISSFVREEKVPGP